MRKLDNPFSRDFSYSTRMESCQNCGLPVYYPGVKPGPQLMEEYQGIIQEIIEEQEEIFKAMQLMWPNLPIREFLISRKKDFGRWLYLNAQSKIRELTAIEKIELDTNLNNKK